MQEKEVEASRTVGPARQSDVYTAGARAIERQPFGVPAADRVTFVLVLVAVAALACWVPARRAARVHPAIALSAE